MAGTCCQTVVFVWHSAKRWTAVPTAENYLEGSVGVGYWGQVALLAVWDTCGECGLVGHSGYQRVMTEC